MINAFGHGIGFIVSRLSFTRNYLLLFILNKTLNKHGSWRVSFKHSLNTIIKEGIAIKKHNVASSMLKSVIFIK